ncbi:MAG: cytochrome c oxidase subunit II [Bacteroidetes bacterium]|nr:cytochrome c oxidase subunit II [Bacteroidota bacterium]
MRLLPYALNHARAVDDVMRFMVIADIILFLIVIVVMLVFVFKYNHTKHSRATSIPGSVPLEIIWTVIPTVLVLAMFYVGWVAYLQIRDVPKGAMPVRVFARQWSYSFEYTNGKRTDTLYVPEGKPIDFLITSMDVIHSFYIPAFREKQDALPDRWRHMVLYPEKLGVYDIVCTQYCGLDHALMKTKMIILPDSTFDSWINSSSTADPLAVSTKAIYY